MIHLTGYQWSGTAVWRQERRHPVCKKSSSNKLRSFPYVSSLKQGKINPGKNVLDFRETFTG